MRWYSSVDDKAKSEYLYHFKVLLITIHIKLDRLNGLPGGQYLLHCVQGANAGDCWVLAARCDI